MNSIRTLAIVVNYHSAALCLHAVRSILDSRSVGPVQVVVADNSTNAAEADYLKTHLPDMVQLQVNAENSGFGQACNVAMEPHDAELILLLNPDAYLLPECLIRLQQTLLSSGRMGAVGPQIYWDRKNGYFLPPSYPPFLFWVEPVVSLCGGPLAWLPHLLSALWRRYAVHIWQAESPVRVSNLSGGHVLLKKQAVNAAGGLFDPRFFMYFEDTDLFLRLRSAGYRLMVDPRAEVVHYYDQCDSGHSADKRFHMIASHQLFMEKHGRGICRLSRMATRLRKELKVSIEPEVKPIYKSPFRVSVPKQWQPGWLFEWSPNRNFIPAAGKFGTGTYVEFTVSEWELQSPGRYYGRLGSVKGWGDDLLEMGWEKTT
jgi:GT2 family glycosyltransferase